MIPSNDEKHKIMVLGDEYDESLRERLGRVLSELGACQKARKSGVAGSQDLEIIEYNISGKVIIVESETYIGLSISGGTVIIDKIADMVRSAK